MEQINRTTRTFILAAVGLAVAIWDISFNFGVYGTIFFEKLFLIWVGCTAVLLAILFLPEEKRPLRNELRKKLVGRWIRDEIDRSACSVGTV